MKRKLLRQIANEWRINLWLVIELLVASVVIWYIGDYMYVYFVTRNEPLGFNADHVYKVELARLSDQSPLYVEPVGDKQDQAATEMRRIINAIRLRPGVEGVSLTNGAAPYSLSFIGTGIKNETDTLAISVALRAITPNHLELMRYTSADPTVSVAELVERMKRGEYLLTDFYPGSDASMLTGPNDESVSASELVGRKFHFYRDSVDVLPIGGILNPVKRSNTDLGAPVSLFQPIDEATNAILSANVISVRVHPEADHDFVNQFSADIERLYRSGNTYVSKIQSYDKVRLDNDHDEIVKARKYVAIMVFILVSVFLGLLGSFWTRTQQRVPEVALRKVCGATSPSVFMRLIGEGLLLLIIATPFAAIIDWFITRSELNEFFGNYGYFSPGRFIITVGISLFLMAVMIIGGTWYPAYRAMKVDPAQALADE